LLRLAPRGAEPGLAFRNILLQMRPEDAGIEPDSRRLALRVSPKNNAGGPLNRMFDGKKSGYRLEKPPCRPYH
jgi:hypothetical protein